MCEEKEKDKEKEEKGEEKERKSSDIFHKLLAAGLGFISLSEEKTRAFIEDLVKRGEISAKEGEGYLKNMLSKIETAGKDIEAKVSEVVKKTVKRESVNRKEEMEKVIEKLEGIEKRISEIEKKIK